MQQLANAGIDNAVEDEIPTTGTGQEPKVRHLPELVGDCRHAHPQFLRHVANGMLVVSEKQGFISPDPQRGAYQQYPSLFFNTNLYFPVPNSILREHSS